MSQRSRTVCLIEQDHNTSRVFWDLPATKFKIMVAVVTNI